MSGLDAFDRAVQRRLNDVFRRPSATIPTFTTFFVGVVAGVILARIACLCTAGADAGKFKPREKFGPTLE